MVDIAPSLLAADFMNLKDEIARLNKAAIKVLHLDIMDGHFVPNLSIGPAIIKKIRPLTKAVFDVHLMVNEPECMLPWFADAGADIITVHAEACSNLAHTIEKIHQLGIKAGVALKPETSEDVLQGLWDKTDLILVMTVNPGFGGQSFMTDQLPKISRIRKNIGDKPIILSVDGGINTQTGPLAIKAGAQQLVAGTAIFKDGDIAQNIQLLRQF